MKLNLSGWTVGAELEGTARCADTGMPADVASLLRDAGEDGDSIGLKGEVGAAQFELHTPVCEIGAAEQPLQQWAREVREFFLRHRTTPVFSSISPFWSLGHGAATVPVESLPRCRAILSAIDQLADEWGRGLSLFGETAGHNALQFHLHPPGWESEDFFGPKGVAIVNAFASRGLSLWFEAEHLSDPSPPGVPNRHNREAFWALAPNRGPTDGPYTSESLIRRWTEIPRLVRREGSQWHVDLSQPTLDEVCSNGLYGTVWERVRPSPARSDKPPTIEVRLWGAVRPEAVSWVLANQVIPVLESIEV